MSDVEIVRSLYASFNARDIDAVLALLAEDVTWANAQHGGHVRGPDAVRGYWTQQWAAIDPEAEPLNLVEEDDGDIRVEVHQVVHDLAGALLLDEGVTHLFRLRDGKVARFDVLSPTNLSSLSQ